MKSHSKMVVTATELVQSSGIDAGLVLVTAESVRADAIQSVTFLGNISDGWCVSNPIDAIIFWPSLRPEDDNEEHVLNRAFSAENLDPSDFTPESVENAKNVEDEI